MTRDSRTRRIVLSTAHLSKYMSIASHMRAYGARPLLLGGALVGIVVVSALAVRESMRNARERRAAAERTVRDYAMFASYLYATRAYLFARDRAMAFDRLHPGDPWVRSKLPPVTELAPIPDTTEKCGPRSKWPVYRFRMDIPSRAITYAGGRPAPEIERIIRDSIPILANKQWMKNAGFAYLFVDPPGERESIAYSAAFDSAKNVIAVYGYRSCYGVRDTADYSLMYRIVKVLPPMIPAYIEDTTRSAADSAHRGSSAPSEKMMSKWRAGMGPESLLTLTITDDKERVIFQAPKGGAKSSRYYGVFPSEYIGGATFWVALRPDVAQFLVAGGIPESRVPASLLFLAGSIMLAIAGFALLRSELRLVNSRQRFLANVSHELRTPLQQILMFVQLLRLGRTRTESERDRSLEIIERETHRLIALSNSVLAATKAEHQLRSAPVDVANVVQTAADFFAPLAEARKMRIELDVAEPAIARGDPGAIRQILINVLDNAAKYGPIGQTITIGVRDDGKKVRLWVDDSGPGIPASEQENVWKPFFRVGGTLDDSTGGAGLGLAIVRDLATAMDADAGLSTTPLGGTRFTLMLHRSPNGIEP
jgi:signal transduction histidine kinase